MRFIDLLISGALALVALPHRSPEPTLRDLNDRISDGEALMRARHECFDDEDDPEA